jgi:hypothetical protein
VVWISLWLRVALESSLDVEVGHLDVAESSLDVAVRHLYVVRTAWMSRSDTLDVAESSLDVAVRLELC